MYAGAIQAMYKDLIEGRKGSSVELVRAIQEANPTLDPQLYVQIQQSVEIFRKRFAQGQSELIAQKQAYQNFLTATTTGRLFNMISGYPHIDMAEYAIVTSGQTQDAFETKQAEPIQIQP